MFSKYLSEKLGIPEDFTLTHHPGVKKISIKKGEILLRAHEFCSDNFFVEKGLLRMYSVNSNGKEHIIQFAPENWLVSDRSSALFNEKSDYFIDAIEDSEVVVFNHDFFNALQEANPKMHESHLRLLHNHVRNLQKRINLLLGATAEERYLDFMKTYPNVFRRVPLWMVASYLGITPESLSRVRKNIEF